VSSKGNCRHALKNYGSEICAGSRKLEKIIVEEKEINGHKRPWTYYQLSPFSWTTYADYLQRVSHFAGGLINIGMAPKHKLAIFEETRMEWTIAAQAAFRQSISVLTVYANLGEEALDYSLNIGEVEVIIANVSNFPVVRPLRHSGSLPLILLLLLLLLLSVLL